MGSRRYGDSLLWVSLGMHVFLDRKKRLKALQGILGVFTAYTIRDILVAVRTAARINHEEHSPELISQHTEDGENCIHV